MDYRFDSKDARFILFEVLQAQKLAQTSHFSEANRDLMEMVLDEAYKFSKDVLAPINEEGDRQGCTYEAGKVSVPESFVSALQQFGQNGWNAMVEDPEWGGQGLPAVLFVIANEMFISGNCALSLLPMLTSGAAHLIERFGTDEMRQTFLDKMYSLTWGGTMCLTEPQAGSDVGNSKTRAIRQPDGTFKIIGTKNFISSGDHQVCENIIHLVLARIEGAPAGTRGLSLFVVPKIRVENGKMTNISNDVTCAGIEHKLGIAGSPTCTMNFGEEEDCIGYLLGEEMAGMKLMFLLMNEARLWVGIQGLALGASAYQHALAYARERIQGSHTREFKNPDAARVPIVAHPDIRRMLMTMKAWSEGIRGLLYGVGFNEDLVHVEKDPAEKERLQGRIDLLTPICKAYGSDVGFELTSLGIQVMGGYGYCKDYPMEQFLRDARIAAIYEGANGIQAMDLFARKLTLKKGALFADFIKEAKGFAAKLKADEELKDIGADLDAAVTSLFSTSSGLIGLVTADMELGLMQATPYLRMFGHVACAYELAKQSLVARDGLKKLYEEKGADTAEKQQELYDSSSAAHFYKNKLATTRFFNQNILTEVPALSKRMLSKDRSALDARFTLEAEY